MLYSIVLSIFPRPRRRALFSLRSASEEAAGRFECAIELLELGKKASPNPAALQKQIDEIKGRMGAPSAAPKSSAP